MTAPDKWSHRRDEWARYMDELQSPPPEPRPSGKRYKVIDVDDPVIDGMIVEVQDD